MWATVVMITLVCLVFLLFGFVMKRRKTSDERPVSYICTECNETDCICHQEDEENGLTPADDKIS